MTDKQYVCTITVKWEQSIFAKNKVEALEQLQETFVSEYNFRPDDDEVEMHELKEGENYG